MLVCMTVPEDTPRWVTLREAADETQASLPALRRWYRQGLIRSVVVPGTHGDQRLVDLDEVVSRAAASPNIGKRRRSSGSSNVKSRWRSRITPIMPPVRGNV